MLYAIRRPNREAEKAGRPEIPHWHPNQLRHGAGTKIRHEFGWAVLGQGSLVVADVSAGLDRVQRIEVMKRVG